MKEAFLFSFSFSSSKDFSKDSKVVVVLTSVGTIVSSYLTFFGVSLTTTSSLTSSSTLGVSLVSTTSSGTLVSVTLVSSRVIGSSFNSSSSNSSLVNKFSSLIEALSLLTLFSFNFCY